MRMPQAHAALGVDFNEPGLVRPSPAPLQAKAVKPEMPFSNRRFLVVEDESLIALSLVDTLERLGAKEARAVSREQECLDLLEGNAFDCALLDANLHGRSVENIAAALTRRQIPFVFITGYGRSGLPAEFQQALVLAKPVSDEELLEAVTAVLSKPRKLIRLQT
jgi:CheY-like chemotaxis protein